MIYSIILGEKIFQFNRIFFQKVKKINTNKKLLIKQKKKKKKLGQDAVKNCFKR